MSAGLDAAADVVAAAVAGRERCFVARALDPQLRQKIAARDVDSLELPHVRGRTVIPEGIGAGALVVVGRPNYLGRFDTAGGARRVLVVADGAATNLEASLEGTETVVIGPTVPAAAVRVATEQARLLVKRLRQLPGVTPAFMPSTPIVILLLGGGASVVADAFSAGPATALSGDYPEFPGGLRLSLPPGMARRELDAYAASLEAAIDAARKG